MVLKKNEGLLHNILVIFKGLFYSNYHLFLIYAFYSNLALSVYFYIQNQKIISYICLVIGLAEYIVCILYDDRYRKIQQKHGLLLNCYDSLPSLFLILDKNWNVVFANDIFQAFSIGKTLNTFNDVLECFVENEDLCNLLEKAKISVEEENYFCENLEIDDTKIWKIYLGLMKKSGKNFYVCYISDIQKAENNNNNILLDTLEDLPEGIVIYNNKEITYTNSFIKKILKSYDIQISVFYENILEHDNKKIFYLSYRNDRDILILKFERIQQKNNEKNTINTYRVYGNEQIINGLQESNLISIILLDEEYNIIASNIEFKNLVSSYFVTKTNFLQYVEDNSQVNLKQYFKEKEKNLNKKLQHINITLGDKSGNLVKLFGEKLQNSCWIIYLQENNIQKDLEKQLLHSQRLGLLGQILSAVSHDFNNILMAIYGFCDTLSKMLYDVMDEKHVLLIQMKHNINKAINLVELILKLSKKNDNKITLVEQNTNVHDIINQLLSNMGRLLGEGININFIRSEKNIVIPMMEPINLEQILLNLIVNARDAMKNNGVITINTNLINSNIIETNNNEVLEPGSYLELSVSDTGEGISEQNKKKIFDAFFTTKQEGTGLGLSTIQSIVKEFKGFIKLNTKLNVGTTFKIYLPAINSKNDKIDKNEFISNNSINNNINNVLSKKTKKVKEMNLILLEDDLSLNQLFENSFKKKSYLNIFSFRSMKDAMSVVSENKIEEIHVLIADVIIKDGNSLDLVEKVLLLHPNAKFILISGHDREYLEKLNKYNVLQKKKNDIVFLQKPFSLEIINTIIDDIYKKFNE